MKIIKGPQQRSTWWIGKTATCEACGTQIELDYNDNEPKTVDGKRFVFCPNCLGRRAYLDEIPQ